MYTQILDIAWIKKQNARNLVDNAKKYGLQNIKNGWPSHQAVFKASCDALSVPLPFEAVRALSGFGGGIAGSRGTCGALCGGIAALGYFFGNNEPRNFSPFKKIIDDYSLTPSEKLHLSEENLRKTHSPYLSLFSLFESKFGSTNCGDLISQFNPDLISRQRFYFCQNIISETSGLVVETAIRECE